MRYLGQLVLRLVLGSYLAVHGAQKLFGAFGGHGLEGTGKYFESMGLKPGRQMAALSGAAELGGGVLTATGIAHPLGPVAIAAGMAAAGSSHIPKGPLGMDGGFELPLTNMAAAVALAASPPGPLRLGPRLPRRLTLVVTAGAAALSGYSIMAIRRTQMEQAAAETSTTAAAQAEAEAAPAAS